MLRRCKRVVVVLTSHSSDVGGRQPIGLNQSDATDLDNLALTVRTHNVVVLLASIAVGANVVLMARQFGRLEEATAGSLLLSTGLSGVTSPLLLALVSRVHGF